MTARSVPNSLAPIIETLELRQPRLVTKELLSKIIQDLELVLSSSDVANRLQKHGWLLSLQTKDSWEFAPASRAGRIGSGDPLIELRATLHHRPSFKVAVAYESAAWLHGFSRRHPAKEVLAIPSEITPPKPLKSYRITRMWGTLDPIWMDTLPVWRIETLIVLMAERPMAYRDWPTVMEWLADAVTRVDQSLLLEELNGRKIPTWARTGYILDRGNRRDIGDVLQTKVDFYRRGPFYLGRRSNLGKYEKRWDVIDSVLLRNKNSQRNE
jgi:hypothetical protein